MKKQNHFLSCMMTYGILLGVILGIFGGILSGNLFSSECGNVKNNSECGNVKDIFLENDSLGETVQESLAPSVGESLSPSVEESATKSPGSISQSSVPEEDVLSPSDSLQIIMVGDILLHTRVEESALRADGTYDFHEIFANTEDLIASADLALVNQEVILGGEELGISGYPAFNAPYSVGNALADAGFDVICHATNHALDKGKKGLINCLVFWKENYPDMGILGIHDSEESAEQLYYYKSGDFTIAILNYTYGTNGISLPADMPYSVDLLEKEKILDDIREAEANADFTIVCPHWGTEYRLTPDSSQEKWTRLFLENGVDLVLGTHPHVIEPYEMLTDEATGHSMLVYYSLGNFVNWTSGTGYGVSNRMIGGMADITLTKKDQEVTIESYGIHALVCHVSPGTDGVTVYPLSDYSEEQAKENAILTQAPDFSYSYCVNLCNQVFGTDNWD